MLRGSVTGMLLLHLSTNTCIKIVIRMMAIFFVPFELSGGI